MTTSQLLTLILISQLASLSAGQTKSPQQLARHPILTGTTSIPGFPFPENELLKYRDDQDVAAIRKHAWGIFSALVSRGARPEWENWYTKCDIPLEISTCLNKPKTQNNPSIPTSLRGIEIPRQLLDSFSLPLDVRKEGLAFDIPGFLEKFRLEPSFANVIYNPEAARHIAETRINNSSTLESLWQSRQSQGSPASETEIPPFPSRAIAIKTIWEQVIPVKDSSDKSNSWILHVWNPDMLNRASALTTGGTLDNLTLDAAGIVSVDLNRNLPCENYDYSAKVPISCFYYQKVETIADYRKIYPLIALLQGSVVNPPFYLVLIGIHIATKETPDWTWSTFYWSKEAFSDSKAKDHPVSLRGPWSHFVMDATLSEGTPRDPRSNGPNICYNPYLEGKLTNGLSSNCLFCHGHASYTKSPAERLSADEIGSPQYYDGVRHVTPDQESAFFEGAIKTDFLWSIADIGMPDSQTEFLKELTLFTLNIH